MKRTKLLLVIMLFTVFFATGCTKEDTPVIEDNTWLMSSVQSLEDSGKIIAYGDSLNNIFEDAVYTELILRADNGTLIIEDKTNDKTYNGTYKLTASTYEATSYDITVNGRQGNAIVSYTVYENGKQPTLIISVEAYAVTFFPQ